MTDPTQSGATPAETTDTTAPDTLPSGDQPSDIVGDGSAETTETITREPTPDDAAPSADDSTGDAATQLVTDEAAAPTVGASAREGDYLPVFEEGTAEDAEGDEPETPFADLPPLERQQRQTTFGPAVTDQ